MHAALKGGGNLASTISEALRNEIILGLARPGSRLSVAGLMERFGVAGTVVREALSRLLANGLVASEDWRGFRVVQASIEDLLDVTRIRINVETQAIREAIEGGDTEWEVGIVAAFHRLARSKGVSVRERAQRHRAFHDALVAGCRSLWLLRFHRILYDHTERYRNLSLKYEQVIHRGQKRDTEDEHNRLMEYALARNAEGAIKAITDHLNTTTKFIIAAESRLETSIIRGQFNLDKIGRSRPKTN